MSTYRMIGVADLGGPWSRLLFVGGVLTLATVGVVGLVRAHPLVAVGCGAALSAVGAVQFLPVVSLVGTTVLVAGVASVVPRPAGATQS